MDRVSAGAVKAMKGKQKIVMLTAYDCPTAKMLDMAGVEMILVGDSVANVLLGYRDTKSITMAEMLHHCRAVARAETKALVVGDMPINSYNNPEDAVENARQFISAGCDAVKIEGCRTGIVKAMHSKAIEVMGHLGLTPQSVSDYRVQGRDEKKAKEILEAALSLERAGCFAIVLECIPSKLGRKITGAVKCPTIGIGAGPHCDGQVLVMNDLLGLSDGPAPKFVKKYAELGKEALMAVKKFRGEVKEGLYPGREFSYN